MFWRVDFKFFLCVGPPPLLSLSPCPPLSTASERRAQQGWGEDVFGPLDTMLLFPLFDLLDFLHTEFVSKTEPFNGQMNSNFSTIYILAGKTII